MFKAEFVYWYGDHVEQAPSFYVLESDVPTLPRHGNVAVETILRAGQVVPRYPSFAEWVEAVEKKKRCARCWRAVRGYDDLIWHMEKVHGLSPCGELRRRN